MFINIIANTHTHIYIYTVYTANCINFVKPKHIVKKACIGKFVTVNTLINLNALDWPKNVPKKHAVYPH